MTSNENTKLTIRSLLLIVERQEARIAKLEKELCHTRLDLDYYNYKWKCTEDYRIEKGMDKLSHQKLRDDLNRGDTQAYEESLSFTPSDLAESWTSK